MREIEIGIHIDEHEGLAFFGVAEVNDLLQSGGRVVAVAPGGAMMRKLGQDAEHVRLTLSGFRLKLMGQEP